MDTTDTTVPEGPPHPDPGIVSGRIAAILGLPLIDRLVRLIKVAAAHSEETYDYNGFLSYHAETHAIGTGLGLGFALGAADELSVLGALVTAVLYGNRGDTPFDPKLLNDLKTEFHYFVAALLVGAVLGMGANLATSGGIVL